MGVSGCRAGTRVRLVRRGAATLGWRLIRESSVDERMAVPSSPAHARVSVSPRLHQKCAGPGTVVGVVKGAHEYVRRHVLLLGSPGFTSTTSNHVRAPRSRPNTKRAPSSAQETSIVQDSPRHGYGLHRTRQKRPCHPGRRFGERAGHLGRPRGRAGREIFSGDGFPWRGSWRGAARGGATTAIRGRLSAATHFDGGDLTITT